MSLELAIARAKGEVDIPPEEAPVKVCGAFCHYGSRMQMRSHWFRMVWRNGKWQYFTGYLKPIGLRSATRHQELYGDVWVGEILAEHPRGGEVIAVYLVVSEGTDGLVSLDFYRRRDGNLSVKLPDGSNLVLPDPRGRN